MSSFDEDEKSHRKKKSRRKKKEKRCFIYQDTEYCDENDCINDLEIRGAIGSGDFGEVYEAEVPSDRNVPYVVKIVKFDAYRAYAPYDEDDFDKEVEIQGEAASVGAAPEIKNAFKCEIREDDFGFIVMRRIGSSLRDYILEREPSEDVTDEISRMLLKRIRSLHSIGIVHGDIRSDNIGLVLDEKGGVSDVLLIDFGSAGRTKDEKIFKNEENGVLDDDQWRSIIES